MYLNTSILSDRIYEVDIERVNRLAATRWTQSQINAWYKDQQWPCGFNFLPSTAVNFIDMWRAHSFDAETIERELGWAREIGFNTFRTNIPFTVWLEDGYKLLNSIRMLLEIADRYELKVVFCLFDDCGFSGKSPSTGSQPNPLPGVHNSRAIASPGREKVIDQDGFPDLKRYAQSILRAFKDDHRILFWDLYNEPGNLMIFNGNGQRESDLRLEPASLALMVSVFEWAREIHVSQPLTVCGWHVPMPWDINKHEYFAHDIDRVAFGASDLISFHNYSSNEQIQKIIEILQPYDRPIMCTEWMARSLNSRIDTQLPLMCSQKIGAWQWGLVQGRTQTHIPWPAVKESMEDYEEGRSEWFHDLLYRDGRAYDENEIRTIQTLTQTNNSRGR